MRSSWFVINEIWILNIYNFPFSSLTCLRWEISKINILNRSTLLWLLLLKKAMENETMLINWSHRSITSSLLKVSSTRPNIWLNIIYLRSICIVISLARWANLSSCCKHIPIIGKSYWCTESTSLHDHHFIIL